MNISKIKLLLSSLKKPSLALLLCCFSMASNAEKIVLAIEHKNQELYSYAVSLLKEAVKNMPGENSLKVITKPDMTHSRIFQNLVKGKADYNVVISGLSPEREGKALIVGYPISRGLLGHRLFIINKDDRKKLDAVKSLQELKSTLIVGSGYGWLDTTIFEDNGFSVEVSNYSRLWNMLEHKRFTGFNRGLHEAYNEIEIYRDQYPNLEVYPGIMVSYPFDYFFHVAPNNQALQKKLNAAIAKMDKEGTLSKHFYSHPKIKVSLDQAKKLQTHGLKVYKLKHNFHTKFIKSIPKKYWHQFK